MANLIDSAEYTANEVYEIQQTDKVEGAASGASFGGIGISNQPHQQLANRTAFLYNQQQTDKSNIATLQGQVSTLFGLVGEHGLYANGAEGSWSWTVPTDIVRARFIIVGGGGAGSDCQANNIAGDASGGGGGAGAMVMVSVAVSAGQTYSGTIGAPGVSQGSGGTTTLYLGSAQIASAGGGGGSGFVEAQTGPGGPGGTGSVTAGYVGAVLNGGYGSDGQASNYPFAGNGAPGPFGGAGRAGAGAGFSATGFGAGGGGAYDLTFSNLTKYGGSGGLGLVLIVY